MATIPQRITLSHQTNRKLWKNPKTDRWERTFAILTGDPNELVAPIHERMTTFLEQRDYEEYLAPSQRPPIHLLRILASKKMNLRLIKNSSITNEQVGLFDAE
jgi:putative SOS response-associated peptidase YedK